MRRSIVIGNVHGCIIELGALLDHLAITTDDTVVFVGDLVAKGPDSRGVLQIVRELGARATLGNHEERLLLARAARREGRQLPRLESTHAALLDALDESEWLILQSSPLTIDLGLALRVVHAGVVPGVPLAQQDPWLLTHLRSVSDEGVPSARWGSLCRAL